MLFSPCDPFTSAPIHTHSHNLLYFRFAFVFLSQFFLLLFVFAYVCASVSVACGTLFVPPPLPQMPIQTVLCHFFPPFHPHGLGIHVATTRPPGAPTTTAIVAFFVSFTAAPNAWVKPRPLLFHTHKYFICAE